ncbi:Protein SUR7 [Nakaseomyces bracarensis]|uniref:Protein SUR7 n=1 Tax=Nakaseomyces bracarensis TaxID=273131 RepID=A0ABR4NLQ8_9SACH
MKLKAPTVLGVSLRLLILLFLAGNVLLLILIVLSGSIDNYPVNRFYWVEGNTSGIPNAPGVTRWTFWGACSYENNKLNCGEYLKPAAPISPVDNFHTKVNVPHSFISKRDAFYYLSRFSFCFFWIALAFVGVSFILFILTWCSKAITQVVFILLCFGCTFNVTAVVLIQAAAAMAKKAFSNDDRHGKVGPSLFGIAWASVFVVLCELVTVFYWFIKSRKEGKSIFKESDMAFKQRTPDFFSYKNRQEKMPTMETTEVYTAEQTQPPVAAAPPATVVQPAQPETNHHGINFFKIRRSEKISSGDEESV